MSFDTDIAVIGGGPAGLVAAIGARTEGFDVIVVDCAAPPIDKTCGEGLMPDSLRALAALGVSLESRPGFPFRGIRFEGDAARVDASFPSGSGWGVKRPVLHEALIDRASHCGVRMLWRRRVTGLSKGGVELDSDVISCRWIIGADGQNSRVRRWAGLDGCFRESNRFGFRSHYRVELWTDCVEIYWGSHCQMYVTPVGPEEVCVVLIARDPHLRIAQVAEQFPKLMRHLRAARLVSSERGAVSASRQLKRVYRDNIALIGDASGSVDAITGEGLHLAFAQAISLASSLRSGDLAAYQREHRKRMRRPAFMAGMMLMLDRPSWLREVALHALSARPEVFSSLLAFHIYA